MRIFITGSNGFVAQKFCELVYPQSYSLLGVSKSENRNVYLNDTEFLRLDLKDKDSLRKALDNFDPTHIFHTAAITAVDSCENNKFEAYQINVDLTCFLGEYAAEHNVHLTFLSTDFVFDGLLGVPYSEDDLMCPVNYYGETKVLAESLLVDSNPDAVILRTILVYGAIPDSSRSNLVLWAKGQLEQHKHIKVVSDQWRMPTWVDDLAVASLAAMKKQAKGIFHVSGEELMSVQEAVEYLADTYNLDKNLIEPISSSAIGQDKNRPRSTGFKLDKAKRFLNFKPTPYIKSLHYICGQLKKYGK